MMMMPNPIEQNNKDECKSMKSISYLKTNTNVNNNNKDILCNNNLKQKRKFLCCIPIK